ncbi:hypothetical protein [Sebaldella sp. S0638]|uniref:hypothetical protein n=1 Tax=Sebaldella sp. S0638 TaxID=2957809 RepID=UPI00209EDC9C|nr:hypothetical protein [Sebaldella sp. S0638]MCP1224542.1 hypothetical protein [Sebaldella sp. S0638]
MAVKIIFFIITLIITTIAIYSDKLINLKRGVVLFILSIVVPYGVGIAVKTLDLHIERDSFMIIIAVTMTIWVVLGILGIPYGMYMLFTGQVRFHKKYNTQNEHVGENLEELGSKENLNKAHKIIKIMGILVSYLMLYGIWFDMH